MQKIKKTKIKQLQLFFKQGISFLLNCIMYTDIYFLIMSAEVSNSLFSNGKFPYFYSLLCLSIQKLLHIESGEI